MAELAIEAEAGTTPESERPAPKRSGRYSIEQREAADLPPSAATPQPGAQAFSVNALSEEELGWIEERTATTRRPDAKQSSLPPAQVFDRASASEAEPPTLSALRAYYREPTLERVQLQFEDKSLDPVHNPLALSSLQPPSKRRPANLQGLLTGVGALALVGVGYLAALAGGSPERAATTTFAPASAPAQAQPMPAAPAPVQPAAAFPPPAAEPAPTAPVAPPESDVPWSVSERSEVAAPADAVPPQAPEAAAPVAVEPPPSAPAAALPADPALPRKVAQRHVVARPTAAPSGLPPLPSREQIQTGIEGLRAALQGCAGNAHGTSTARLTILGTGRVASATIEGAFAGTAQGSCMARALRTASFPRFASENLQVTYPFRL
jgi:hypothetical protein